jgi:selenide, water dikinase
MNRQGPVRADIVLVGGGHAHVHVLRAFAMRPENGVRLTLIARDLETPYSGMLPGVVAGLYAPEQAHIDLVRLAAATAARLIHAEAIGLDRVNKRVLLADRPPIAYDVVSIDVGITPALTPIPGAAEHGIAVKPIGRFMRQFEALIARCRLPDGPQRIGAIGGGAGGVELILSVRARLLADARRSGRREAALSFALVTDGEILETHNRRVREAFRHALRTRGVELHEHRRARAVTPGAIECETGNAIEADAVLVATDAAPPAWFGAAGLALDPGGFIAVRPTLQTLNDPDVFAVGDCAALLASPRDKAGVFAVRSGPPLAANLRRHVGGRALRRWHPQRRHLALISTGERHAIASRAWFKAEGAWVWKLKDLIDRRWMRMYQDVDAMVARMAGRQTGEGPASVPEMRCGGCAAKVGPGPLSRALSRLPPRRADGVIAGIDPPDDGAVIAMPPGDYLVQTADFFRAFLEDPYVFGEIAANHALSDVFAMGGLPHHALVTAVVPFGPSAKVEETLFQLLAGARAGLDRENVLLVGGHSSEGADMALGFSVTGTVARELMVRKGGVKSGDVLILTKPLGTGILFAAAMRAQARASFISPALTSMRRSNRAASAIFVAHGATAMTDVTGFGLAGHLAEMLAASGAEAQLDLCRIPLYEGALALAKAGLASTLLPENLALATILRAPIDPPTAAVLFDPQTSGGLLAAIPPERAEVCVSDLRRGGEAHAAIIGRIGRIDLPAREVAMAATGSLGH